MRIAVPDLISPSYFPAVAAVDLGIAAEEGLELELELLFPVTTAMQALRDGRLDFVAGAAHATLTAFPGWRGAKLLAALARHMYWFLVLRSDLGAARGDIAAVKGLRIGAAPGVDLGLRALLREGGVDPDSVQIGPVPGAVGDTVSFGVTAAKALEKGLLDGFWANGMGAEVAVRRGTGTVVIDVRRGDGPPAARDFTFPALVATEESIARRPDAAAAAVRAIVRTQRRLREAPEHAAEVGRRLFPPEEAELIAELVARDAPFYDPVITQTTVTRMNAFAMSVDLLPEQVSYEQVVATELARSWHG